MAARQRLNSGGGFAAALVVVLGIGIIIKYFWWVAGAAALVGLFFAVRALLRQIQKRRELAEEREAELQRQADRQHRWLITGDSRGVYGADGASVMRAISSTPELPEDEDAQENPTIAALATTAEELTALANDKPQGWEWALFTSVLMQRRAPLLPRLRDSELGFTPAATTRVQTGPRLAQRLLGLLDEMTTTVQQLESFMLAPAFMRCFGGSDEESTADADAIMHTANRLMDYHDRFLQLSEQCRGLSASSEYADVIRDCARLLETPLQGYREFIDELVGVIEALPRVLLHATGVINMGQIQLHMEADDRLMSRTFKRLRAISRS